MVPTAASQMNASALTATLAVSVRLTTMSAAIRPPVRMVAPAPTLAQIATVVCVPQGTQAPTVRQKSMSVTQTLALMAETAP